MKEKFSDYESTKYIDVAGEYAFTVKTCERKMSAKGNAMEVFGVESAQGSTSIYMSLNKEARWKYNAFIKACLALTPKQVQTFECDYNEIGQTLIGKRFIGVVKAEQYEKEVKEANDDGTFDSHMETRTSYKIDDYKPCTDFPVNDGDIPF